MVAVGGDTVGMRRGELYLNGEKVPIEPILREGGESRGLEGNVFHEFNGERRATRSCCRRVRRG